MTFGLSARGMIKEGYKADIVVFDAAGLKDRATYESPFEFPEGVVHVIVNGVLAVLEGRLTGRRQGRALRGGV